MRNQPRNYFTACLIIGLYIHVLPFSIAQIKNPQDTELKHAAELFRQRKHWDVIPILEKLAALNPSNDQAVFGLGVALIMKARRLARGEERKRILNQAIFALLTAKKLGVDDYLLEKYWNALPADGDDSNTDIVEHLAVVWSLHPPKVFDNEPPRGIGLPQGYRHKNSRDFEGLVGGIIWKPGGLKIEYEFASSFQEDAVKGLSKSESLWYQEKKIGDLRFKYALTKGNRLVITVLYINGKESPIATFFCQVGSEMDIEEALSIVTGLKEESSHLPNR